MAIQLGVAIREYANLCTDSKIGRVSGQLFKKIDSPISLHSQLPHSNNDVLKYGEYGF